ncbi:MAG: peptide chain release factor 2 [Synergistaceae bacterium]|nr:peptide chain release factor 2 [Synergistaceae bacterium]MBQ9580865.1 peptide chain release factor 2 [Synergistaceae bacterium]MBQ9896378.1 peptide chain release factor 2 [Synergistaceae bacterium]MBR0096168.1 peptide chain release factor 2 [Synergistaceae bacterium]MBR0220525.1 peptide chain release factor 2 [Synergistaceae bacterium]
MAINLENIKVLDELRSLKTALQDSLDVDNLKLKAHGLEVESAKQDFWNLESNKREEVLKDLANLNARLEAWRNICSEFDELEVLEELLSGADYDDKDLAQEFNERALKLREDIEHENLLLLLIDNYDACNAILTVHAGSGGLDSQDWAEMLLRMYLKYCERENFKIKILNVSSDEEAGIKSAEIMIEGDNAYGFFKSESGVHRLVRISPFDAAHRRHTSFASVLVSPEIQDNIDLNIDIRPEDLKIDTFRASGAGGQYVNRTDSAVRITHLPSNIVVTCQNERSQHMNKQVAMRILKSRLYEKALNERQEQLDAVVGDKKESSWGSQIRSYTLHPYTLVKDHRTNYETGNIQAVLDGNIDKFIMEYLRAHARGEI